MGSVICQVLITPFYRRFVISNFKVYLRQVYEFPWHYDRSLRGLIEFFWGSLIKNTLAAFRNKFELGMSCITKKNVLAWCFSEEYREIFEWTLSNMLLSCQMFSTVFQVKAAFKFKQTFARSCSWLFNTLNIRVRISCHKPDLWVLWTKKCKFKTTGIIYCKISGFTSRKQKV
jgi:hypothetical protein